MMNSYSNSQIGYIMQAQSTGDGTYLYILVDNNLVDDSYIKSMTPTEATRYALVNKIERISSGSMAILRSDKINNKKYLESI